MTLLVVGASGYLGAEVCRQAAAAGERVVGTYHRAAGAVDGVDRRPPAGEAQPSPRSSGRSPVAWCRLDVCDRAAVRALVATVRPRAVVNTASGYADWATTADGAGHVAAAAAEVGARLVHLSSDAVHGGRSEPYADDEPPSPVFPYGAAKAAAETAVRLAHPAAAVIRTSLIVGDERSKHVRLCLDAIHGRGDVRLFADEIRCPVAVDDLAAALLELVGAPAGWATASDYAGLLNVAGPEAVSRLELGVLVARRYGLDPARVPVGRSAAAGLVRPAEVRLDSSRATALVKTRLRGVTELLAP